MSVFTVNRDPSAAELRKFGRAMVLGFGVIGGVVFWAGAAAVAIGLWSLGAALFLLTRISLSAARPVYLVWMTAASLIGVVMSTILLTLLYVTFVPVFSLIVRCAIRFSSSAGTTHWEDDSDSLLAEGLLRRRCRPRSFSPSCY